nr:zinc finger, CCHC-type [Tanacetum cinerariifolium]
MARNTVKDMTTNFGKLDKFEGHDFRRWQKKMHFLLTTLKVVYVLTTSMPELLEDATVKAIRIRAMWDNDDYICKGHILNGMSDFLFDVYTNVESVKELWDSLESKPVMEQYNELLRILRQYTQHGLKIDESISVSSIIDKLPPSWKDFKHTLKHGKDDLSLVQLGSHLRIHESLRAQDSDKGKGKQVAEPSVNMIEAGKNKNNKQNKGKKRDFKEHGSVVIRRTQMLVVREKGQRTILKTKVDAIAWWIDSGATNHVCKDRCWFKIYEPVEADLAIVRLPDPKRKTLGEKGIDCIFVGYAEHSKAYRFYVIEPNDSVSINSIIESRDAIFGENRFSSILRPKDIIPNVHGSQIDDHTDDVPSEILEPRKGCKWIFKRKMKVDGIIDKFKARLVIQGFRQKEGIDYFDTYAPVARITTIRLLLALAVVHNLVIHQIDVKTTFLNVETKKFLSSSFSMKDMKEADVVLGIKIKRENNGIVITQSHYIEKILKKFNREDCFSMNTLIDPVENLKPNTRKPVDQFEYSRAIGCLMYAMTSTRPDIAYTVGRLSRFTSNPSRHHWKAITRVFKYLKGTKDYGLSYVGYPSVLKGYSDASWINHVKDSASTSGWVFLLGGALAAAGKEAEWLRNLIHEILIWKKPIAPISIRCDSASTMARAYSQIYNEKSRHLGVRHSMVRELIRNGVISIEFVRTQHNLANHLTNGLARDLRCLMVVGGGV